MRGNIRNCAVVLGLEVGGGVVKWYMLRGAYQVVDWG